MAGRAGPPPLPPRASSSSVPTQADALPAYTELDTGPYASLASDDPRSSSTQSLLPEDTPQHNARRTLLLVYIHGFMGAETSFQSFPLHVHRYLTLLLADSHVVHTKIYPRYRSKRQIQFARDDFSQWLTPHESPQTDVVLLGHSMGGLLAAEVALMPSADPTSTSSVFKHCILGTINFDVPFLGMHPGVVSAGLASIFRGKSPERKPGQADAESNLTSPSMTTISSSDGAPLSTVTSAASSSSQPPKWINSLLAQTEPSDPNFNPKFNNDVNLPMRKGWNKALHFISKHSDNLVRSSQNLIKSHLEFGGAMADYSSLKARYNRLRMLEDDDEGERRSALKAASQHVPRIRFVNYYTASTGRPKKPPPGLTGEEARGRLTGPSLQTLGTNETRTSSRSQSPRISVEEVRNDGEVVPRDAVIPNTPRLGDIGDDSASESSIELTEDSSDMNFDHALELLPEIPPEPQQPDAFDHTRYEDLIVRKLAQRQYDRAMRAYKQAVRHRNATLKDRAKFEAKNRPGSDTGKGKASGSTQEPGTSEHGEPVASKTRTGQDTNHESNEEDVLARYRSAEVAAMSAHRDNIAAQTTAPGTNVQSSAFPSDVETVNLATIPSTADESGARPDKKKKDRKFCMLPGKDARGQRDPTWVRIFMKDIDEVTAHCGLFMQETETYETLVGEVGQRVEEWVREDMSRRLLDSPD